jgi:hypothetical protein
MYRSEALTVAALFVAPPLGVMLMWLFQTWDAMVKAAVTVVALSGLAVLVIAARGQAQPNQAVEASLGRLSGLVQPAAGLHAAGPGQSAAAKPGQPAAAAGSSAPPAISTPAPKQIAAALASLATAVASGPGAPSTSASAPAAVSPAAVASSAAAPTASPTASAAAATAPQPSGEAPASTAASVPAAAASAPAPAAGQPKLAVAQKTQVQALMAASVARFEELLTVGKQTLGATRYKDTAAANDALDDPKTPAAKFRDWRDNSKVEDDTPIDTTVEKIQEIVTEPNDDYSAAFDTWVDNMHELEAGMIDWSDTAADWQSRDKTDADLAAAEKSVRDLLAKTKSQAATVIAKA